MRSRLEVSSLKMSTPQRLRLVDLFHAHQGRAQLLMSMAGRTIFPHLGLLAMSASDASTGALNPQTFQSMPLCQSSLTRMATPHLAVPLATSRSSAP